MEQRTGRFFKSNIWKGVQALFGLILIYLVFTIMSSSFRSFDTFKTILTQAVIMGTLAAGPTIVLISGGLDLSIGSLFCLVSVVTGRMLIADFPVAIVVLLALGVGALCGAFNGGLIVGTGIPAFIGTLGMMKAYRGVAEILGMNQDMSRFPESFQMIGRGYLIPISIMAVTYFLVYVFLSRTKIGFNCYAIGGNNEVARLAGVPVKKYYIIYYTLGGVAAAISALILVSRLNFTNSAFGVGFELNAIAAVIIGGTSLSGGVGGIGRTLIGVLIVTTLNAGLSHMGVSSSWQQISIGFVIILAVWLDFAQRRNETKT